MGRFYEGDQLAIDMVSSIIYDDNRFPNLKGAVIKVVMDNKPKIDKFSGILTFAYIKTSNEVERFLTRDGHNLAGVDYILFINDLVWEMASPEDKKRIISHELRHTFLDDKGNFKLIRHDIEDFYSEIKLNEDDPMWGQSLSTIVVAKVEQDKAEAKANR